MHQLRRGTKREVGRERDRESREREDSEKGGKIEILKEGERPGEVEKRGGGRCLNLSK